MDRAELERLVEEKRARRAELEARVEDKRRAATGGGDKEGILGAIARPLDFAGGVVRTGLAGASDIIGGTDLYREGDWKEALKGNAPDSAKILARGGVGKMGSLSDLMPGLYSDTGDEWLKLQRGGALDPTGRGTMGFALDVASDPSTYGTIGFSSLGKAASKLGKAGRVVEKGLKTLDKAVVSPIGFASDVAKGAGEGLYKYGLRTVDQMAEKFGKDAPSDLLFRHRVAGSAEKIADKAEALSTALNAEREAILQEADRAGARVDVDAAMKPAVDRVERIAKNDDPALLDVASALKKKIEQYRARSKVPGRTVVTEIPSVVVDASGRPIMKESVEVIPEKLGPSASQASGWKSSLYDLIGPRNFETAKNTTEGKNILKAMGFGLKEATEKAVQEATGEGVRLAKVNNDLGSLLTTRKAFGRAADKEIGKNGLTEVDAMLLGFGSPAAFASKKAIRFINSPQGSSRIGLLLDDAGNLLSKAAKKGGHKGEQMFRQLLMGGR